MTKYGLKSSEAQCEEGEREMKRDEGGQMEREAESERGRVNTERESRPNTVRTLLHALIRKFSQSALLIQ